MTDATPNPNGRWPALLAILTGAFLINLDVYILNLAIPSIRRDLGTSLSAAEFVVVGYAVTYGSLLVSGGRLGDRYGRKKTFLLGILAFAGASVLCGVSPNVDVLIAARLLQGVAAAIVMPQVLTLIRIGFPDDLMRAHAFALLGAVLGLSTIVGQIVGGLVVGTNLWDLGWRLVFLINVPIGAAAIVASLVWIEESSLPGGEQLDLVGAGLSCLTLSLLLFGLGQGRASQWPWWSIAMLIGAAALATMFFRHQAFLLRSGQQPLVDLTLFRERGFSAGVAIVLFLYSALASFNLFLPIYLQDGIGLTAMESGWIFIFAATPFLFGSMMAGWLVHRWGTRVLAIGAALVLVSSAGLSLVLWSGTSLEGPILYLGLIIMGAGYGLLETPLLNLVLSQAPVNAAGMASGIVNTTRQLGGAIGITIVGMAFSFMLGDGYGAAFLCAVGYQIAAMVVIATFCGRSITLSANKQTT